MRLTEAQKIGLYITVGTCAVFGIVGAVLLPTITAIRATHTEMNTIRTYLEQKYQRTVNIRDSLAQLVTVRPTMAGLEQYLYTTGNEIELITLFETLANQHAIQQKIIQSNLDAKPGERITLSLHLVGTYDNLFKYLHGLEQTDYFISLTRLHLQLENSRTEPSQDSLLRMDVILSLYVAEN